MVAPLIGAASRMIAKKIAENPQKSLLGATGASLGTGTYLADATADKSYKEEEEKKKKDKESEKKKNSEDVEKKDDGGRTKYIDRKMPEGKGKDVLMGTSRFFDKMGLRQDKTYEGKSDEEIVKKRSGGKVSSASKRADGCAQKGKTKGRMV
jgi:hypothetical protein